MLPHLHWHWFQDGIQLSLDSYLSQKGSISHLHLAVTTLSEGTPLAVETGPDSMETANATNVLMGITKGNIMHFPMEKGTAVSHCPAQWLA